jgi:hypothetical protein
MTRAAVVTLLCVGSLGVPSTAFGQGVSPAERLELDEIAAGLDAFEQQVGAFDTHVVCTTLVPRPVDEDGPWDESAWIDRREARWRQHDGRIRLDWTVVNSPLIGGGPEIHVLETWDGSAWRNFTERDGKTNVRIQAQPRTGVELDCLPFFNMCKGRTCAAGWSLSRVIRDGEVSEFVREGSRVDLVVDTSGTGLTLFRISLDSEPNWRLLSFQIDILGRPDTPSSGGVAAQLTYRVDEWGSYNGVELPKVAYRDMATLKRTMDEVKGVGPKVGRTIIRRTDYRTLNREDITDELFTPAVPDDAYVDDDRFKLRYHRGAQSIRIDGFRFRLDEPVPLNPGPELPELIDSGSWESSIAVEKIEHFVAQQKRSRLLRSLGFGGIAFLAGLILWGVVERIWRKEPLT